MEEVITAQLGLNTKGYEIEKAHRTGKVILGRTQNRPRSIAFKLLRYKDQEEILSKAKLLKGTGIFINEDLSDRIVQITNDLRPKLRKDREKGNVLVVCGLTAEESCLDARRVVIILLYLCFTALAVLPVLLTTDLSGFCPSYLHLSPPGGGFRFFCGKPKKVLRLQF